MEMDKEQEQQRFLELSALFNKNCAIKHIMLLEKKIAEYESNQVNCRVIMQKAGEIKMQTPFADIKIIIEEKDWWAKEEIEDWIFSKCGLATERQIQKTMQQFEDRKKEVKSLLSE